MLRQHVQILSRIREITPCIPCWTQRTPSCTASISRRSEPSGLWEAILARQREGRHIPGELNGLTWVGENLEETWGNTIESNSFFFWGVLVFGIHISVTVSFFCFGGSGIHVFIFLWGFWVLIFMDSPAMQWIGKQFFTQIYPAIRGSQIFPHQPRDDLIGKNFYGLLQRITKGLEQQILSRENFKNNTL